MKRIYGLSASPRKSDCALARFGCALKKMENLMPEDRKPPGTLTLLKLLAIGDDEISAGLTAPARQVVARLKAKQGATC